MNCMVSNKIKCFLNLFTIKRKDMGRNLNDIFSIDSSKQINSHLELAVENLMDGNSGDAYNHFAELLYEEFELLPNDLKQSIELYRFTGLPFVDGRKPVIEDIKGSSITFTNPKLFNDPMDPILKEWIFQKKKYGDRLSKKICEHLLNALGNLRICCLAKCDDSVLLNPIMWGHYANKHEGICIKYEITPESINAYNDNEQVLRIGNVRYRDHKVMSDYILLDNALLAKGRAWDYEKETRLIYYSKKKLFADRKNDNYETLSGFKIKSIYLGKRISDNDKIEIIEAAKKIRADVYQMGYENNDITKLAVGQQLV